MNMVSAGVARETVQRACPSVSNPKHYADNTVMGFRFRRSVKLFPGLRLNFGKRGVSAEHVNGLETHLFTSLTSNWV